MDPSKLIDKQIAELGGWRGEMLGKLRKIINDSSGEIKEDWKWGSPVWIYNGLVCSLGSFKDHVKIHFFKGVQLTDPKRFLNAGLEAKLTRGIDLFEGDKLDEVAIRDLVRQAVDLNAEK